MERNGLYAVPRTKVDEVVRHRVEAWRASKAVDERAHRGVEVLRLILWFLVAGGVGLSLASLVVAVIAWSAR